MEVAEFTKLEQRLLSELKQGQLTRAQLAEQLGRKALNTHDIATLEGLVARGLVEKQEVLVGAVMTVNHYRLK